MKKIVIPGILVLIVISAVFVYASNQSTEVLIFEGWNMVYGFTFPDRIEPGSEIAPENIKAVYLLLQPSQEYVRLYPDAESEKLVGIDDDYYEQTAQWVFSDKQGVMNYEAEEPLPASLWDRHQLYEGWNMIGITPDMGAGDSSFAINDFAGSCDIEKVFFYSPSGERWVQLSLDEDDVGDDLPYLGIVMKVSNDCVFGLEGVGGNTPPAIPN